MSDGQITAAVLIGMLALIVLTASGALVVKRANCLTKYEQSTLPVRWSIFGGCRVKTPDQGWIPSENYRVF